MDIVETSKMAEGECPVVGCGGRLDYDGGFVQVPDAGGGYYQAKCAACGAEMKEWFKLEFEEHEVEVTFEPPGDKQKLERLIFAAGAAEGALSSLLAGDAAPAMGSKPVAAILHELQCALEAAKE